MTFRKSVANFIILMALGLFGYLFALDSSHPEIFVNYHPISSGKIDNNLALAYEYYHNALLYSGSDPGKLDVPGSYNELKRAVMDEVISGEIIYRELKSRIGSNEANKIANRNIEKALGENQETEKGIKKLYGLNLVDFKNQILLPRAYREILEGRMSLNNLDFNSWLIKARSESSVLILSPDFVWDGEKVVLK